MIRLKVHCFWRVKKTSSMVKQGLYAFFHRGIFSCFLLILVFGLVSRGQMFMTNCPAYEPMCQCPAFENGCFVCKCPGGSGGGSASSGSSTGSGSSSLSGSNPFPNFHLGEFPSMSGTSTVGGTSSGTVGSSYSSNASRSGSSTSGSSGSSSIDGGPSSGASGSGSLNCAPLPSNCPPFMVRQDFQGCAVCSTSGSGGLTAGQLNNCPPIDFACPALHTDRKGCLLCGSGSGIQQTTSQQMTSTSTVTQPLAVAATWSTKLVTRLTTKLAHTGITSVKATQVLTVRQTTHSATPLSYPSTTPSTNPSTQTFVASKQTTQKPSATVTIETTQVATSPGPTNTKPMATIPRPRVTVPPSATRCAVCAGPPEACELAYYEDDCLPPNNYCVNNITNLATGVRLVDRKCGSLQTCYNEWYLQYYNNNKCRLLTDPTSVLKFHFHCTFCCVTDGCNVDLRPKDSTLYTTN